jgi:hypothetical protein
MEYATQTDSPPQTAEHVYNIIMSSPKFLYQAPSSSASKSQKIQETPKITFSIQVDSCELFFCQKMPISSNFHFSPNLTGKLNFSTDTQLISLDQDKIIPAHKNLFFLTENYPLTIFPIQFPDFFLISFIRIFIQSISNSLITTINSPLKTLHKNIKYPEHHPSFHVFL